MDWEAIAVTDRGRVRANNEDAHAMHQGRGIFVLADGMGGHAAGEVASTLAVDVACKDVATALARPKTAPLDEVLRTAVVAAHHAVIDHARRVLSTSGMGTTLVALLLHRDPSAYWIAHVGDSRAYLIRGDEGSELRQLTTDHTWVQEEIDRGRLSPDEARRHPNASVLTRAVGTHEAVPVIDVLTGEAHAGDTFLLCSDGLTSVLGPDEIRDVIVANDSLETIGRRLIESANQRGGPDNITVVLVRITNQDPVR